MPKYLVIHTIDFEIEAYSKEAAEAKSFEALVDEMHCSAKGPSSLSGWNVESTESEDNL